ncbi:Pvc16 family protein [Geomonas oryzisoli]|uniref:Pvc16 family protein n=1 Tax=Geomonas oryzisoli TaxID=2847992 RepID=UPI001EF10A18|nr:Pvc16 family protein [Geomonas oryzisoli]
MDQLQSFKLIFDIYSPTLEEVHHLWGPLGGKQYPFILYIMRSKGLEVVPYRENSSMYAKLSGSYKKTVTINFRGPGEGRK